MISQNNNIFILYLHYIFIDLDEMKLVLYYNDIE